MTGLDIDYRVKSIDRQATKSSLFVFSKLQRRVAAVIDEPVDNVVYWRVRTDADRRFYDRT